jgi:XapX domain-containing protein
MKILMGLVLALLIGVICRLTGIPVPAPPVMVGALLVLAMTGGYILADRYATRPAKHREYCGGPSGTRALEREVNPPWD